MDLTNTDFTPIGTEEHPFEGIFEGPSEADKAEIKLSITRNDLDYAGLFGVLGENAEVRNLSVSGTIDNTRINQDTTNDLPTPSSGLITPIEPFCAFIRKLSLPDLKCSFPAFEKRVLHMYMAFDQ